jgi:hypothetical protein
MENRALRWFCGADELSIDGREFERWENITVERIAAGPKAGGPEVFDAVLTDFGPFEQKFSKTVVRRIRKFAPDRGVSGHSG